MSTRTISSYFQGANGKPPAGARVDIELAGPVLKEGISVLAVASISLTVAGGDIDPNTGYWEAAVVDSDTTGQAIRVRESVNGANVRTNAYEIQAGAGTLDLRTLVPVTACKPYTPFLTDEGHRKDPASPYYGHPALQAQIDALLTAPAGNEVTNARVDEDTVSPSTYGSLKARLDAGQKYLSPGTGAVWRYLKDRTLETVSALDFIPVAEHAAITAGTSTTNVAAYLQNAIAYVKTKGGVLHIPAGTYPLGATGLVINVSGEANFAMVGDGRMATKFTYNGTGSAIKFQGANAARSFHANGFGVNLSGSSGSPIGIQISGIWRSTFSELYVINPDTTRIGVGIQVDGASGTQNAFDVKLRGLYIARFAKGLYLSGTNLMTDLVSNLHVDDSYIAACVNNVYADYAGGVLVTASQAESSVGDSVYVDHAINVTWIGGAIEGSGGTAWNVSSTYGAGVLVYNTANRIYERSTAGNSASEPTHTSGTVDGWIYLTSTAPYGVKTTASTQAVNLIGVDFFNNLGGNTSYNAATRGFNLNADALDLSSGALIRMVGNASMRFFDDSVSRDVRVSGSGSSSVKISNGAPGASSLTIDALNRYLQNINRLQLGDVSTADNNDIITGTGSPEGVVSATPGSIFLSRTGGPFRVYFKADTGSGNTGWLPLQVIQSGSTANRPTGIPTGYQYYDTTLSRLIVYDGTAWVIAPGTATTTSAGSVLMSAPSADTAIAAAGANPTKAEFDALLNEVRDLKTKLRNANILAP